METVKLRYSAPSNISFRGEVDTGISREDWDNMTYLERDEVITEALYELVDIGEVTK